MSKVYEDEQFSIYLIHDKYYIIYKARNEGRR